MSAALILLLVAAAAVLVLTLRRSGPRVTRIDRTIERPRRDGDE